MVSVELAGTVESCSELSMMSRAVDASAREEATLPFSMPAAACCCRSQPPRMRTRTVQISVVTTTRNGSEPHQALLGARSSRRAWSRPLLDSCDATGLVPDPSYGQYQLRSLGVLLDLGPQPLNVDVDEPGVGSMPVAPDLLEQLLTREDLMRLPCASEEEVELQRGEGDGGAPPLHLMGGDVDRHVTDTDHVGLRLGRRLHREAVQTT